MLWRRQMADVPLEGVYRRQIELRNLDERTVVGWLEDESHHFGLTLVHDGERIEGVRAATPRHPWTTCAEAGRPLQALVGKPLVARCSALGSLIDMNLQCTHLFDLASLMVAHARARRHDLHYHGTVRPLDAVEPGAPQGWLRATLYRNGKEVMWWNLADDRIMAPSPFSGRSIYLGFREWTEGREAEEAEHALVLRRVAFVSNGRRIAIEHLLSAAELAQHPVCHSFQPGQREIAFPIRGSRRRFDQAAQDMLPLAATRP